ncbi:MAG: hypothetical protein ACFFE2_08545 [Candidatus Thorarchaeota archaeon]
MTGRITWRKPSLPFIIKLLVVLLFPLNVYSEGQYYSWVSILFSISNYQSLRLTSFYALVVAIVILFPGFLFERRLNSKPFSESARKLTVVCCILTWFIGVILMLFLGPLWLSDLLYFIIMSTPNLTFAFFIILPTIMRESTKRGITKDLWYLSYGFVSATFRKKFRRTRILTGVLWFGLVFSPFLLRFNWGWYSPTFQFISLILAGSAFLYIPWLGAFGFQLLITVFPALYIPVIAVLSSVRIIFVRDIFRYQNKLVTRSRLISVALLGELLPSALVTTFYLITIPSSGFVSYLLFYPTPILPIIGLIYAKLDKIQPIKEELWPDYEHRMWFEKEREPYTPPPAEESIKVPLTYLLISQIRKRRNG